MNRFIIAWICMVFVAANSQAQFSGGNGLEASPYLISSKADMETLSNIVIAGNKCEGLHFLLTQDLKTFNTITFSICMREGVFETHFFGGHFNGGGHEIELTLTGGGLFALDSGGVIENLTVSGTTSATSARDPILQSEYGVNAGGIASSCFGTIRKCVNKAKISIHPPGNYKDEYYAGGIAARCYGGAIITDCYNMGEITTITSGYASAYAGGITGFLEGNLRGGIAAIRNCYNTGNISARGGGICGFLSNRGKIENCFTTDAQIRSGGRIFLTESAGTPSTGVAVNCYATLSVTVNGAPVIGQNAANGMNGADTGASSLQNGNWIAQNLGWDFQSVWKAQAGAYPALIYGNSAVAAEPALSQEWPFSPNPAQDYIYFASPLVRSVEIFTVTGRRVIYLTDGVANGVNVSTLSPGVYFMRAYAGGVATSKKLIVQR